MFLIGMETNWIQGGKEIVEKEIRTDSENQDGLMQTGRESDCK